MQQLFFYLGGFIRPGFIPPTLTLQALERLRALLADAFVCAWPLNPKPFKRPAVPELVTLKAEVPP